jgi:GNAT superfamily N-acetyltransferase
MLRLDEHADPRLFCGAVLPLLLQSEAENCTQIGLLQRMAVGGYAPVSVDELDRPLLLTVQDGERVELVGVQTLKTKMLVTRGSDEAAGCLGDGLAQGHWAGREIIGIAPSITTLAERYSRRTGLPSRLAVRLRTFQLTKVVWPAVVAGSMRLCEAADQHLLARFLDAFAADVGLPRGENGLDFAARLIEGRRIVFWVDREPVAMAGWAGRTPNGIRINSVYTPPEFRGRGYASNLVARLTQRMLDEGRRFCFLHTDLANPTSNSIYQKVGYRPVCDSEKWEFA